MAWKGWDSYLGPKPKGRKTFGAGWDQYLGPKPRERGRPSNYRRDYDDDDDDYDDDRRYIDPNEEMELDILEAREGYNRLKFFGTGLVFVFAIIAFFLTNNFLTALTILIICGFTLVIILLASRLRLWYCENRYRNKLSIGKEFRGR